MLLIPLRNSVCSKKAQNMQYPENSLVRREIKVAVVVAETELVEGIVEA
jgi:hypothetical protein